jgi:tight adherence protein B
MALAWVLAACWILLSLQDTRSRLADVLWTAPPVARGPLRQMARRPRPSAFAAASVSVPIALCLELRAGRQLSEALSSAAEEHDHLPALALRLRQAASVALVGGDVGATLAGGRPGDVGTTLTGGRAAHAAEPVSAALAVTAACCGSSLAVGLPLADLLAAAAAAARSAVSLQGMARAELAGARSTSLVLALLPVAGAAMGQLVGARPLHALFATTWGAGCLLLATVLTGAGVWWTRAITSGLRRSLA